MKHVVVIALSFAVALAACKKNTNECTTEKGTTVASAAEEKVVTDYLSANNITNATELEGSGMYYIIDTLGTGTKVNNMCSYVAVTYTGKFTNGNVFESVSTGFTLGGVIEGWRRGVPLIATGGTIRLFIPSSLAYGAEGKFNSSTGVYSIPPNTMLIFTIKLIGVSN